MDGKVLERWHKRMGIAFSALVWIGKLHCIADPKVAKMEVLPGGRRLCIKEFTSTMSRLWLHMKTKTSASSRQEVRTYSRLPRCMSNALAQV